MNAMLLPSSHRHVSAAHITILRAVRTRIQIQLCWNLLHS